jgi:hypothetical protein
MLRANWLCTLLKKTKSAVLRSPFLLAEKAGAVGAAVFAGAEATTLETRARFPGLDNMAQQKATSIQMIPTTAFLFSWI